MYCCFFEVDIQFPRKKRDLPCAGAKEAVVVNSRHNVAHHDATRQNGRKGLTLAVTAVYDSLYYKN
jgi:hypothetical protein